MRFHKTKIEQREKEAIIRKHTYTAWFTTRWDLEDACRRAVGAGGELDWFTRAYRRLFPKHRRISSSFRRDYCADPARYGRYVARRGIYGELARRLHELKNEMTDEPFLILRSLYPTSMLGTYSGRFEDVSHGAGKRRITWSNWYISESFYDVISSGLLATLGVRHQPKSPGDRHVHLDYFTTPAAEIDQFAPDEDFPRRFRQAVPELALLDEPDAREGHLTARYVVYVCVENPIKDPLWVLPVRHVFDGLSASVKSLLRESLFEFFDHWEPDLTNRGLTMIRKIIGQEPNEWLSFDGNRLNWDYEHTKSESYPALGRLRSQIIECGQAKALPIVLKRGDALIVDNYRALVKRTEAYYWDWSRLLIWRPSIRWIKMYCGFPELGSD